MISTSTKKKKPALGIMLWWMAGDFLFFFLFFFLIQWMRQCSRPLKRILIDMQLNSDSPLTLWEIHFSRRKVKMWDLNWMISSQREVPWKLWSLCPPLVSSTSVWSSLTDPGSSLVLCPTSHLCAGRTWQWDPTSCCQRSNPTNVFRTCLHLSLTVKVPWQSIFI